MIFSCTVTGKSLLSSFSIWENVLLRLVIDSTGICSQREFLLYHLLPTRAELKTNNINSVYCTVGGKKEKGEKEEERRRT